MCLCPFCTNANTHTESCHRHVLFLGKSCNHVELHARPLIEFAGIHETILFNTLHVVPQHTSRWTQQRQYKRETDRRGPAARPRLLAALWRGLPL